MGGPGCNGLNGLAGGVSECCIHFEDWTGADAVHLLQRYGDEYCIYGDDVQGTAGIVLTGMINAAKRGEAEERKVTCSLPGDRHGPRARFRDRRW